jgi:HEAT repeat protein
MSKHVATNLTLDLTFLRRKASSLTLPILFLAKIVLLPCLAFGGMQATQTTAPGKSIDEQNNAQNNAPRDSSKQADAKQTEEDAPTGAHNTAATPAQRLDEAWSILATAVNDPKHTDLRIQALAACGTLGTNPRSAKYISKAMDDKDIDVRTAAILAAGQTHNRNLTTDLRTMLDDKEPQVAFAAALTLWEMKDRSGEDILIAVVDGDRSANATAVNGARQGVGRSLRHPGMLARMAGLQGAAMLLGPFGFGITAYEYLHKNGADTSRVAAIEKLAEQKNQPIRHSLIEALGDNDLSVRAAAAKALGGYHERPVADALFQSFADPKAPVRLTAAAAYINSTQTGAVEKRTTGLATHK